MPKTWRSVWHGWRRQANDHDPGPPPRPVFPFECPCPARRPSCSWWSPMSAFKQGVFSIRRRLDLIEKRYRRSPRRRETGWEPRARQHARMRLLGYALVQQIQKTDPETARRICKADDGFPLGDWLALKIQQTLECYRSLPAGSFDADCANPAATWNGWSNSGGSSGFSVDAAACPGLRQVLQQYGML